MLETAYGRDVVAVQQHDVRRWIRKARDEGARADGVVSTSRPGPERP